MEPQDLKSLRPALAEFLDRFSDCLDQHANRAHFRAYVQGQFSDLQRKNVEAIANDQGVHPRTLQEFLAHYEWVHARVRTRVAEIVATEHAGPGAIGIIDETSAVKKGVKTPGVQRQYCGAVGKNENCIVTVHLAYTRGDFHCLLDGDLFLPESWAEDRDRCRAAGIPDEVVYRPKTKIALERYREARNNGIEFDWLTFDEWYGSKPGFLRELVDAGQNYVGETHKRHVVWFSRPTVTYRPYRRKGRKARKTPRVTADSPRPMYIETGIRKDPELQKQPWEQWHVKDTDKGPKVVEVKSKIVYPKDDRGLPMPPHQLLIVRDVLKPEEEKYFLTYARDNPNPSRETQLKVGFTRWVVERCFEDDKGCIGLDHYEGRCYTGLIRHLIISAVSLLFLACVRARFGIRYAEVTVRQMRMAANALIQSLWLPPEAAKQLLEKTARIIQYHQKRNAQARKSHTKTRNKVLAAMGIDMATIKRCNWDTS